MSESSSDEAIETSFPLPNSKEHSQKKGSTIQHLTVDSNQNKNLCTEPSGLENLKNYQDTQIQHQNKGTGEYQYSRQQGQALIQNHESELDLQLPSTNHSQTLLYSKVLKGMCKTFERFFYRIFRSNLMTHCYHSLKAEQQAVKIQEANTISKRKEQNWPFKELYHKGPHRTQNEQIMFEFISMCAQKIQAAFQCYITRKRHLLAKHRVDKFKEKMTAVVRGWKCWTVYNCEKIKKIRKELQSVESKINSSVESTSLSKKDKLEKIEYFNCQYDQIKKIFHASFNSLRRGSQWRFYVEKCFQKIEPRVSNIKYLRPDRQRKKSFEAEPVVEAVKGQIRNKRRRQFLNVTSNKAKNSNERQHFEPQRPIEVLRQNPIQQRPIVAKGQYKLNEEDLQNAENQFLKGSDPSNSNNTFNKREQTEEQITTEQSKAQRVKHEEKKKLAKRKMYDPRKAIEEEKKRKLQERAKQQQQMHTNQQNQIKTTQEKADPKNVSVRRDQQQMQRPKSQSSEKEKTVQKVKKQSKLTKRDDHSRSLKSITPNPRKNVTSKINCWGNKRPKEGQRERSVSALKKRSEISHINDSSQVLSKDQQQEQSSYKSKFLTGLKQKSYARNYRNMARQQVQIQKSDQELNYKQRLNRGAEKYSQPIRIREKEMELEQKFRRTSEPQESDNEQYQSSYLKKMLSQKQSELIAQKGKFSNQSIQPHKREVPLKNTEIDGNFKAHEHRMQNLQNHTQSREPICGLKKPSEEKSRSDYPIKAATNQETTIRPKQEVYRSIESLQEVYNTQYGERLNNLKGKLHMLESTRLVQKDDSVPVLSEKSRFVDKIFSKSNGVFSSQYWPQVRSMQTNFLDYIRFNLS